MSTYYASNLFTQLSFNTHLRFLPLHWLRGNGVRCFSHSTDGSGLPVRYISKRRREASNTNLATSVDIPTKDAMPSSSDLSVSRRKSFESSRGLRAGSIEARVPNVECELPNVLVDPKYGGPELNNRGRNEVRVIRHECIKVHQRVDDRLKAANVVAPESLTYEKGGLSQDFKLNKEMSNDGIVDEEYMETPEEVFEESHLNNENVDDKSGKTKQGAKKVAVELLAKRSITVVELRKKLTAKHFPLNIVEAVLRDFQNRGLINDGLYAETFSHSRWKSSSWGPRRIKQALTKKGVSEQNVQKAVKLVFEDPKEDEQRSSIKLSSSSLQQLYMQASKQWQRSQNVPHETRKARVIRWLHYRGFDWGVVGTIMKKLESEHPH
ncbi:hypothetical protein RND81_04G174800 [Saponaria officinalis]|uniref:Regulatory protein RecX n=1 Tax=Saponaria officinalis TaxID=3572 RepID=A0AAW1LF56_SAPOF